MPAHFKEDFVDEEKDPEDPRDQELKLPPPPVSVCVKIYRRRVLTEVKLERLKKDKSGNTL